MQGPGVSRAAGLCGVLAAVLILGGLYMSGPGADAPGRGSDAAAWAAWARQSERSIELGVYVLLFPGLLLFLGMFAALAGRLPALAIWTRLAGYGAVSFFVLFGGGAALASTSPSAYGFYPAFNDPTALIAVAGTTAGYHFQALAVWTLALTIVATAAALRASAAISTPVFVASIALAGLAAVANLVGFGIIFVVIWILGAGVALLRGAPRETAG